MFFSASFFVFVTGCVYVFMTIRSNVQCCFEYIRI